MKLFDVSVPISRHTPVFPGDPKISITAASSIKGGDAANVSKLDFGAHTATHVDAPAHFIDDGKQVKDLSLDVLIGAAQVVEIPKDARSVNVAHVKELVPQNCERVLFKTRNSDFWQPLITLINNSPNKDDAQVDAAAKHFHEDFVYIESDAAQMLVEGGVKLVGIDYLSVEKYQSGSFGTHEALLGAGIVIIEGLNLAEVAGGDYELFCLPIKIAEGTGDGAPARVVLRAL